MSGKYFLFTLNGEQTKSKLAFVKKYKISMRKLNEYTEDEKGTFELRGEIVSYEILRQNEKPRNYIPNPKGFHARKETNNNPNEVVKIVGNLKLIYSKHTNKLIKTISI